MAFFASFLRANGLFERLVASTPFEYANPNTPDVRNVVGTMVLSILAGHKHYCHIGRLRNDEVCAELLVLTKIVSDESARRALAKCDEAKLSAWLSRFERASRCPTSSTSTAPSSSSTAIRKAWRPATTR